VSLPAAVYRPRNPQLPDYYRCVADFFETFISIYDECFSRQYGFWRPYIEQVIYRYLDCGDLHNGFARVKLVLDLIGDAKTAAMNISWPSPVNEGTPVFTRASFCPSCHQKRVAVGTPCCKVSPDPTPPKIHAPPIREYAACDLPLQTHADDFYGDPDYSWDQYIRS